ncbi:nuclear transport factor 2 family protein [Crossiella sp. SN42]|uniref:nuclear transport factor 2 family protein n=1 Tax=Crossiella sp. SN42 TaxID=2944808 RepID=UPI00207CF46A|nr:nuclear transport factor 2 family protein [Crossiella sp. SN42]MCO1575103.1 nuclear transport factor 2 family protein [Crossiella sp. SN42]
MSAGIDEREVRELVAKWAEAEGSGDAGELGALLTEDFVGVGPQGFVRTRAQWLGRHSSGAVRNTEFTVHDYDLRRYGDTAVVVAAQTQQGTNNGADASGAFRFTLVLVRDGAVLRLAGLHLSPNRAAA